MLKRFIATAFLLLVSLVPKPDVDARSIHGSNSFTPAWRPLRLGAGGQITSIRNYADGTMLARTDTLGAYLYVPSGSCTYGATVYAGPCWQILTTATSIPNLTIDLANGAGGVAEIVAAPSNTNTLAMLWEGFLYVSTDKGASWVKTTQTTTIGANDGNSSGPWIAIDPNDDNAAFISSGSSVVKTTNLKSGGSATFSAVASIGSSAVIAYEPGSSTHILAARIGSSVVESTNGSTFSATTGSHTSNKPQLKADKFSQFFLAESAGSTTSIFKYASSTWSTLATGLSGEAADMAIDPNSASVGANIIFATNYRGELRKSADNGGSWTGSGSLTFSAGASQPTWLGNAYQGSPPQLNGYSISFDTSSNLRFAGGIGVWKITATVSPTSPAYAADTLGIEQLVVIQVITPPGGCDLIAVWDRGFFRTCSPDAFVSNYWENSATKGVIVFGWSIDYASNDPAFITGWESNLNGTTSSASSTDGGNSYTVWGAVPSHPGPTSGWVAALTNQKWVVIPDISQPISFTTNGGTSWTTSIISGTPTNWLGRGAGAPIAADRVAADTYCAVTTAKVFYKSTDAGANWASTAATVDGSPNLSALKSVSGQSGHFWYTAGYNGSYPSLWKSTNTCTSFTKPNSSIGPSVFGFGAQKPGTGTYPTLYVFGQLGSTQGVYQSIDAGVNYASIDVPASQKTWPLNSVDLIAWLEGDPDIYGRIKVGFRGSGGGYINTQDACPYIAFSNIVPNQALTGASVTLTAVHATDPTLADVPVIGVAFYLDGVQIGATQTGQTSYSVSLNASAQTPGTHQLKVQAAGNGCTLGGTGNSKTFSVTTS